MHLDDWTCLPPHIVNPARAEIMVRDDVVRALESGQLAGYAGDVWFPQPPAVDHPWRTMPHNAMTTHMSGTTLSAQAGYAAGTREILEDFLAGRPSATSTSSSTAASSPGRRRPTRRTARQVPGRRRAVPGR